MVFSYSKLIEKAHYHHYEYAKLKGKLSELYFSEANFLDVGFGHQKYLNLARQLGYSTYGVEVNRHYVEMGNSQGHLCYHVDELHKIKTSFDVILLSHVIEHLAPNDLLPILVEYINKLKPNGIIIIASPVLGHRFYFDFTHIRPYYPQSIWHVLGGNQEELSVDKPNVRLDLVDIYYIKDCYRTRFSRSYYIKEKNELAYKIHRSYNYLLASLYILSGGRWGKLASWIAFYKRRVL